MEVVYLVCSIIYTTITTIFLSLLLPFGRIIHSSTSIYYSSSSSDNNDDKESVTLYQGTVWHERRRPVKHSFTYSARYAFINLDICSHPPPNHFSAQDSRLFSNTNGPQYLLTIPPSVGYEQNPLSLYYCYDLLHNDDGASTRVLTKCIAEVTNTPWGERVRFLFNPNSDLVAKPLHVSPFMDMLGNWSLKTNEPGDKLHVVISVQHPQLGNYFTASLTAKKVTSADDHSTFFWLMPHKVALWIYWHAFKLWWKNVSFIQHPRYNNPAYREDALLRNESIQLCPSFGNYQANNSRVQGIACDSAAKMSSSRCFTWTDAPWPWC